MRLIDRVLGAVIACSVGCSSGAGGSAGTGGSSVLPPTAGAAAGTPAMPGLVGTSGAASPSAGTSGQAPMGTAGAMGTAGVSLPTAGTGGAAMTAGAGGAAMTAGAGGSAMPPPRGQGTCLLAGNGNYDEPGPYQTGMMDVSIGSSGMYTIFYPMPLEEECLHPIVAWGNGTGVTGSGTYAFFNDNAASWGMVVAASHESNVGSGEFHRAGIDWLLAQNEDSSSMFFHKLSTKAGMSGHSQGGIGATAGSTHPNVIAEVCVAGGGVVEAKVAFICLTGTDDFVNGPCTSTYMSAPGPAFLADWQGGDHVTTETVAGYIARDAGTLQMQRFYAAWFRCFLADDNVACAMFEGSPCGVCGEMGWANISSRNL